MNNKYNIVVSTDSKYLIHTQTLISSIETNVKGKIKVFVLSFGLTEREKLETKNLFNCEIIYIDLTDEIISKRLCPQYTLGGYMSVASYGRLLIPELLPKEIDKCLYLDVDGIVLKDLDKLWEYNLDDYVVAGCKDITLEYCKLEIGIHPLASYINAGFILFNLKRAREIDLTQLFSEFIIKHKGNVLHMDQGVLNGVLSEHILLLPFSYNVLTPLFFQNSHSLNNHYFKYDISESDLENARNNPLFVHFTAGNTSRPWEQNCKHPYRRHYWEYREKLGHPFLLDKDKRSLKLRIIDWGYRNFPSLMRSFLRKRN